MIFLEDRCHSLQPKLSFEAVNLQKNAAKMTTAESTYSISFFCFCSSFCRKFLFCCSN